MRTKRYPMVQFKKDTWEIDEFDCASMYLLVGTEKAMLIDCGMGIGDLKGAVEMITDKPLIVVISHGHLDHTGNARQFDEVWIHPKDAALPMPQSLERRRFDIERIANRQKGGFTDISRMFNLYPYDLDTDLLALEEYEKAPVLHDLTDGMQFDLGGGRIVTAYECPGHSAGEMVFLDEATRTLIAGDALNFNLGVSDCPLEVTLRAMKRIQEMSDRYDGIWNGHHDFRALGDPLDDDCLPTVIEMMEEALQGNITPVQEPSFWGEPVRLSRGKRKEAPRPQAAPGVVHKQRTMIRRGRNFLSIDPKNLFEEKGEVSIHGETGK